MDSFKVDRLIYKVNIQPSEPFELMKTIGPLRPSLIFSFGSDQFVDGFFFFLQQAKYKKVVDFLKEQKSLFENDAMANHDVCMDCTTLYLIALIGLLALNFCL